MKNGKVFLVCLLLCVVMTVSGCALGGKGGYKTDASSVLSAPSETPSSSAAVETTVSQTETASSTQSETSGINSGNTAGMKNAMVGPYEITDINNTLGVSNKKTEHSFGIARNGKPHSISVNYQKSFDSKPQYKGLVLDTKSTDKRMYLTFDCGYEYEGITGDILDVLKEKNVKAVFFCTLSYIKNNKAFVRRMIDEGHIVGNHSARHPDFTKLSRVKMAKEIYDFEKYLKDNYNYTSKYFRFPEGSYSDNALDVVSSMGYRSVFWSVAHVDYDTANQPTVEKTVETVTSRYHSGAVILLHAISRSNADALGELIDKAKAEGYTFKTLNDYPW